MDEQSRTNKVVPTSLEGEALVFAQNLCEMYDESDATSAIFMAKEEVLKIITQRAENASERLLYLQNQIKRLS